MTTLVEATSQLNLGTAFFITLTTSISFFIASFWTNTFRELLYTYVPDRKQLGYHFWVTILVTILGIFGLYVLIMFRGGTE